MGYEKRWVTFPACCKDLSYRYARVYLHDDLAEVLDLVQNARGLWSELDLRSTRVALFKNGQRDEINVAINIMLRCCARSNDRECSSAAAIFRVSCNVSDNRSGGSTGAQAHLSLCTMQPGAVSNDGQRVPQVPLRRLEGAARGHPTCFPAASAVTRGCRESRATNSRAARGARDNSQRFLSFAVSSRIALLHISNRERERQT